MKIDAKGAIAGRIEIDLRHGNLPFDTLCLMARLCGSACLFLDLGAITSWQGRGSFRGPIYDVKASVFVNPLGMCPRGDSYIYITW